MPVLSSIVARLGYTSLTVGLVYLYRDIKTATSALLSLALARFSRKNP
jgi:hypothetical protein